MNVVINPADLSQHSQHLHYHTEVSNFVTNVYQANQSWEMKAVEMPESNPSTPTPTPGDTYNGWLFKWTNYIKGYQRRWFVLSNGLLSYYR